MIYHKPSQICFLMVPKTGSTSLRKTLADLSFKVLTGQRKNFVENEPIQKNEHSFSVVHPKLKDYIDAYPNLRNYKFYGVFRDPVERFLSAVQYLSLADSKIKFSDEEKHQQVVNVFKRTDAMRVIFEKQVEWLDVPNINIIDFNKYEEGVLSALKDIPGEKKIYKLNESKTAKIQFNEETINYVKNFYKDDYDFIKDKLGTTDV